MDQARAPEFLAMVERALDGRAHPTGERAEAASGPPDSPKAWSIARGPEGWGRWRRGAAAGGLLAAAAMAGLFLVRSPGVSEAEFERVVRSFATDPAGGAWRSPTDGLLELPGQNMLSTRPSIGTAGWPGGLPASPKTIYP
jgi:hypothetical protein